MRNQVINLLMRKLFELRVFEQNRRSNNTKIGGDWKKKKRKL
jgi:hypothetical protein